MQSIYKYENKQINCVSCAVGFGEPLKKRKAEEGVPEAPPSPQPPLIPTNGTRRSTRGRSTGNGACGNIKTKKEG